MKWIYAYKITNDGKWISLRQQQSTTTINIKMSDIQPLVHEF